MLRKIGKLFLCGLFALNIIGSSLVYASETPNVYTGMELKALPPTWPQGPQIEGKAAIVMDISSGCILYDKAGNEKNFPASITKIMTVLLSCEALDENDELLMSNFAANNIEPGSSSIYASEGEKFTVLQADMACMLESANEMCLGLSEKASGSLKKFVELMNKRAREIGCKNTHFNNPNGLPDESHYVTAYDMAKIAKVAISNPLFGKIVTTSKYSIPPTNKQPETRYFINHHKMMPGGEKAYPGVIGGKTGYTDNAGNTLVTYVKNDSLSYVVVVLGSVNGAYDDTKALIDFCNKNFKNINNINGQKVTITIPNQVSPSDLKSITDTIRTSNGNDLNVKVFTYDNYPVGFSPL